MYIMNSACENVAMFSWELRYMFYCEGRNSALRRHAGREIFHKAFLFTWRAAARLADLISEYYLNVSFNNNYLCSSTLTWYSFFAFYFMYAFHNDELVKDSLIVALRVREALKIFFPYDGLAASAHEREIAVRCSLLQQILFLLFWWKGGFLSFKGRIVYLGSTLFKHQLHLGKRL